MVAAQVVKLAKPPGASQARGHAIARAIDRPALRQAYEAGASTVDLALRHGISRTTIRVLLIEAGCRLRDVRSAARARHKPCWVRLPEPEPVGRARIVEDVDGVAWRVHSTSRTKHGFAVLRGQRITGGAICIILTPRLARHFERHRLAPRNLELPISQSVINRLRRRLDQRWMEETNAWWLARRRDLDVLDAAAFSARHGVAAGTAMVMRRRLCGARPDRLGWLTPEVAAAILARRPARDAAAELGLSADRVYALRWKLRTGTIVVRSADASSAGAGRLSASLPA